MQATSVGLSGLMSMQRHDGSTQSHGAIDSSRRLLMDTFGESLKFVNRLYNKEFGTASRKVSRILRLLLRRDQWVRMHAKLRYELNDER